MTERGTPVSRGPPDQSRSLERGLVVRPGRGLDRDRCDRTALREVGSSEFAHHLVREHLTRQPLTRRRVHRKVRVDPPARPVALGAHVPGHAEMRVPRSADARGELERVLERFPVRERAVDDQSTAHARKLDGILLLRERGSDVVDDEAKLVGHDEYLLDASESARGSSTVLLPAQDRGNTALFARLLRSLNRVAWNGIQGAGTWERSE